MNVFGDIFKVTIWGESHGEAVGITLGGVPAGIPLSDGDFESDLKRRQSGARGTTPRKEGDVPQILSGVFNGYTTGAPLTVMFANSNTKSKDYSNLVRHPRPSHADRVAQIKWGGYSDYRGGGHFSGRLTLPLVAAGVVAKRILGNNYNFTSQIIEIGGERDSEKFSEVIDRALAAHDSVGGVIESRIEGVEAGIGEPFFNSVESKIAHLLFSVPAVKGVEFGAGFKVTSSFGTQNNDTILDEQGHTLTNNDGGVNGGIANGNPIVVRAAIKPTPSISAEQMSYNFETGSIEPLKVVGRHDACIALRATVVVEAAVAIALADLTLSRVKPRG
ncbi:MAG: chorismate synthase [Rikenellaceae bacterium]